MVEAGGLMAVAAKTQTLLLLAEETHLYLYQYLYLILYLNRYHPILSSGCSLAKKT